MENMNISFFDADRNLVMRWYDISIKKMDEDSYYSFKLWIKKSIFMAEADFEWFSLTDIQSFIKDLEKMYQKDSLTIRLSPLGEFFVLEFKRERTGRIEAKLYIYNEIGSLELSYSFDQTFLPELISELKRTVVDSEYMVLFAQK